MNAPAVLLEGFFVDSNDALGFDTAAEQKKLAAAYAQGVLDYFGVKSSSYESAKKTVQTKAGLSDSTIAYLEKYQWAADLFEKLAKAMK